MIKFGDRFKLSFETYEVTSICEDCDVIELDGNIEGDEIKIFIDRTYLEKSFACKHFYDGEEMQLCDLSIEEMRMCIKIIENL